MALTQSYNLFMTTKPLARRITEAQREWIYVQPLVDKVAAQFNITLLYTDGTTYTYNLPVGNFRKWEVVAVPVDFASRGYNDFNPAKTIATITIKMAAAAEDIVVYSRWAPQTENNVELYYFNSLGGMDSFICTGNNQAGAGFSNLIGRRFTGLGYQVSEGSFFVDNQITRDTLTLFSGFKPATEIEATLDMLHTNRMYRRTTVNGIEVLLPYIYEGDAIQLPSADENLKAISFSMRAGWEQKARGRVA